MSSSSAWRSRTRWRQTSMASPSTPGAASHGRIQATRAAISRAACWPGSSMMISTMPRTSVTGVSRCPRPLNLKSLLFAVTSGWSCCRRLNATAELLWVWPVMATTTSITEICEGSRLSSDCILNRKSIPQGPFGWIKFADPSACIKQVLGGKVYLPPAAPLPPWTPRFFDGPFKRDPPRLLGPLNGTPRQL